MPVKPKKNNMKDFKCNDENCSEGKNCKEEECRKGLKYKNLSMVYFQIFTLERGKAGNSGSESGELQFDSETTDKLEKSIDEDSIDKIIFSYGNKEKPIKRHLLEKFSFEAQFNEPYEVKITGTVYVEMSLFFNKTVSLAYNIKIDRDGGKGKNSELLSTDHIIHMISLAVPSEKWDFEDKKDSEGRSNIRIDNEVGTIKISGLYYDENGDWSDTPETINRENSKTDKKILMQVFDRYKIYVMKKCNDLRCAKGKIPDSDEISVSSFVYVDIWETLTHCNGLFDELLKKHGRTKIISHIEECHKKELMGIMSMYPEEWPYRDAEAFNDVCGENIAIDTDDLVLVNQNICIAFGTYGLTDRGKATIWDVHLDEVRERYHVSWPEYILILEMILAQRHTIEYTSELLFGSLLSMKKHENLDKKIEKNADLFMETTKLLAQLDAVKYSKFISHKIMHDRTNDRLKIDECREKLEDLRDKVDESIRNVKDTRALRHSKFLNFLLAGIAVASMFAFLFEELHMPILGYLNYGLKEINILSAIMIFILVFLGVAGLGYFVFLVGRLIVIKLQFVTNKLRKR